AADQGDVFIFNYTENATGLTAITANGLEGDDVFNVRATAAGPTLTLSGGNGNDTFNFSSDAPTNAGNLNGILGAVTVNGDAGTNTLNLSDAGNAVGSTYSLAATLFQRLSPAATARVAFLSVQTVNLNTGTGDDTINVFSTAAGPVSTVNANNGNDTITSGPAPVTVAKGTLDLIQGALTVNGNAGTNTLNFNDQGSTAANTYTLTATTFQRPASTATAV